MWTDEFANLQKWNSKHFDSERCTEWDKNAVCFDSWEVDVINREECERSW
jgi:hypothetical protein